MAQDLYGRMMHRFTRDFRHQGFSFPVANGLAIDLIERSMGGSFDWRASFAPTANDERLLRALETERGAA